MPVRAVLLDLDNTLLLEDEATRSVHATGAHAAHRIDTDPVPVAVSAAAASAAEELFRSSPVFPYANEVGIWWAEALWGDFDGDAPGLRALRAFVPGFRQAVWKALAASGLGSHFEAVVISAAAVR